MKRAAIEETNFHLDRDGNPAVNNGLIPAPRKDEYNAASTEDDAKGRFKDELGKSLKNLGTDDAHIAMLAKIAVEKGDILRLDVSVPRRELGWRQQHERRFRQNGRTAFEGRRDGRDLHDYQQRHFVGDKVNADEVPFRDKFPFVADPTQPFPPGSSADDHTRQ